MRERIRSRVGGEQLAEIGPVVARVIAIGALVLAVMVMAVLLTRPRDTYEVTGIFDQSRGLIEGGEVTAGFQKVGTVSNVTLGEDGLPHVTMKINGDFPLHQGATADIRLSSNVGAVNRVVDLEQGDTRTPKLEDGAVLGPTKTDQPVDLDLATSTLDPETRKDAAALLAGLDRATRNRGPDINRLLQHSSRAFNETANLLGNVNQDGAALRALIADTGTVVGALAQDPDALGAAADRTAQLLDITARRQAELRRTAGSIGPALLSGRLTLQELEAAIPDLRGLVRGARPVVSRLRPVAKSLPKTIEPLRPTLAEARSLINATPGYALRITPAIEAVIPLLTELEPTLKLLNPFLDHLRVRAPEIVGFFALSGDLVANFDINGHMIRFIPRLTQFPTWSAGGHMLEPSERGAGLLKRPFHRTPGMLEGEPWENYPDSFIGGGTSVESEQP